MSFQEYAESAKGRLRLGSINAKAMAGVAAVLLVAGTAVAFNVAGSDTSEPLTVQKATRPRRRLQKRCRPSLHAYACMSTGALRTPALCT